MTTAEPTMQTIVYTAVREALAAAHDDAARAPQQSTVLKPLDTELLLALSWAGPFTTRHLQQLLSHAFSARQVHRRLHVLERSGYIAGRTLYHPHTAEQHKPPLRKGRFFAVTELGRSLIVGHDREPYRAKAPQERVVLAEHDGWVSSTLVQLITQTRSVLSAVGTFREMRIDPDKTRPIADCVIWLRSYGMANRDPVIHWSRQYRQPDEDMLLFAIEVDRGTEELGVITAKATNYRTTATDPDFLRKYAGAMPTALWVAPTQKRMESIHARWVAEWPSGTWWLTHDAVLAKDIFWEYADQTLRKRHFLETHWADAVQRAAQTHAADERTNP